MKKFIVLLISIFSISTNVFGQSKRETQEWIKFILESNTLTGRLCDIRFSKDGNTLSYYHEGGPSLSERKFLYTDIPVKEIKKITFLSIEKSVYIKIEISTIRARIRGGIVSGNYPSGQFKKEEGISYQFQVPVKTAEIFGFKSEILSNGTDKRLLKAFSHLVKLNGGIMMDDMFK